METKSRRYRGSYLSYLMIYFFSYFAMAAFSSVLSVYLTGEGKSATEMSFIVSAAGLFSFAMVPAVGYLCDRLGRPRQISAVLLAGMGILAVVFSFCRQVWALFLLNGLIMSFLNSIMPVSEQLASASKFRYGVLRVWGTLGYAAGAQAAGLAFQSFPPIVLFSLVFVSCLLASAGFLGAEDSPLPEAPSEDGESPEKAKLSSFLGNRYFLLYLVISFLCAGCSGANMTYAPMLLNEMGLPTGIVGTVLFFSTLVEIPIILFSNKFMDRFSGKSLLVLTFVIFIVQYLFYGLSGSVWVVVAAMVLLKAIASTLMMMIVLKMVRNIVSPGLTTTGLSVVNSINSLGTIAIQNLGGVVTDYAGLHVLYLGMAGMACLGLLLTLFLKVGNREKVFA